MRAVLLFTVVALAGCLFVGDVNERPAAFLDAQVSSVGLGTPIVLNVQVTDDQLGAHATLQVCENKLPFGADPEHPCVDATKDSFANDAPDGGTQQPTCQKATLTQEAGYTTVTFFVAGTYTIIATPTDTHGATGSPSTVVLTAVDEPLEFSGTIQPGQASNACGSSYTAALPVPIVVDGAAQDPEAATAGAATCAAIAPALAYHWALTTQPTGAGRLGHALQGGACPSEPLDPALALDTTTAIVPYAVCLYPDPGVSVATASSYVVTLGIDDGVQSHAVSANVLVPVLGDAPACLGGTYPAPGSYVVSREDPTVFQVVGADDTTPATDLEFTWSLERDGVWTTIVPSTSGSDGGARLSLDPSVYGFAVGEDVTLRVEVAEPGAGASGCSDDDATCVAASCVAAPATTCPRRATWALELR